MAWQEQIRETATCLRYEQQETTESEFWDPKSKPTDGNAVNQFRYT